MYDLLYKDDSKIKYKNKIYNINIAFNRFLKAIDLMGNEELSDEEKVNYVFECFMDEKSNFNINEKSEFINTIFEKINEFSAQKPSVESEKTMDIKQDFEYIYSSFMADYNIDLIDQFDKLSWLKFMSLLGGLSKNTKMAEVIRIRTMDIPKANKDNAKDRANIIKQKAYYALKQTENNFEKQMSDLFSTLKGLAKK